MSFRVFRSIAVCRMTSAESYDVTRPDGVPEEYGLLEQMIASASLIRKDLHTLQDQRLDPTDSSQYFTSGAINAGYILHHQVKYLSSCSLLRHMRELR